MTFLLDAFSRVPLRWVPVAAALCLVWSAVPADTVVRRDGGRLEGRVVSVDENSVVLTSDSGTSTIPRSEVATISFSGPKPLSVAIENVRTDDAVDVFLEGDEVVHAATDGGAWIEFAPELKEGDNGMRLRIHNDRGVWAYRLLLRNGDQTVSLECGTPQAMGRGCTCCGKTGAETGVIDDLPTIGLHGDRALGRAEVLP
jgi:RNase P/RNase MRP subunit p29